MDYREQERFFRESRLWGCVCVVALISSTVWAAVVSPLLGSTLVPKFAAVYAAVAVALAASLYYTPDYLNLSVNRDKPKAWAVKVRLRISGAVLLLGLVASSTMQERIAAVIAVVALLVANHLAAGISRTWLPAFYAVTDVIILGAVHRFVSLDVLTIGLLSAAIAHFSIVTVREDGPGEFWFLAVLLFGLLNARALGVSTEPFSWTRFLPFFTAVIGTEYLRRHAATHHRRQQAEALQELASFSGKRPAEVADLWRDSNRLLAEAWKSAALNEDDHAAVKEWYRQNSGLYLYAISGHNLEYKKIVANLRMLRFARRACLDYGAGNGELVLELARRGHPATYYDVDGETMRFARWRAERRKLNVSFATAKEQIARGLGTIYSFDVLEHVPDLEGELTFLTSLLAPGGLLLCDVPAGATKNHPMHLDHRLNVSEFLRSKGLKDRRGLIQRLTSSEKYIFQA